MDSYDWDDSALDGRDSANIFDVQDVFPDEGPQDGDVAVDPVEETDTFVPDDALGEGGPGVVVRYAGGESLEGVPTRAGIVEKYAVRLAGGGTMTEAIREHVAAGRSVFFMPNDVEETNEYVWGRPVYLLRVFGALMDGSKAEVMIEGVDVFFDVRVPADAASPAAFEAHLRTLLAAAPATVDRFEHVSATPIRGFNTESQPYLRLHAQNLQERKKAIAAVRERGYETASDDRSRYYRKFARENGVSFSDWVAISDYEYKTDKKSAEKSPLCPHVFRVKASGYKALVDPMAPKPKRERAAAVKARTPLLAKDRTLVVTWDGETRSTRGLGNVPDPAYDTDTAFMFCLTAHWKDDPTPLEQVCIVDIETAPDPRWTTVVCDSPVNVLRALALVFRALAPDIVAGFNDSNYDWPFVVKKASRHEILGWLFEKMSASPRATRTTDESVMKWNYRHEHRIKISAEESFLSSYLKVPGSVPIDVRVCYKKLYPKSETPKAGSLKFYLEVSKLSGKADMPIARMWRIYDLARDVAAAAAADWPVVAALSLARRAAKLAKTPSGAVTGAVLVDLLAVVARLELLAADGAVAAAAVDVYDRKLLARVAAEFMRHVAHYCVLDALRCQQLLVRRNIVNDGREVSSLAYVSFADSHYYAGGMKVCNLLGAYAWRRNILTSMIPRGSAETGKYPGAYVFPPEKGISPDPDHMAAVDAAAAKLRAALDAGDEPGAAAAREEVIKALADLAGDRPVTGLDFSSLYPSLIMTYNLSPEKIVLDEAEAQTWAAAGYDLHPIEFPFNGRAVRGWSIRHRNEPADIGLYPSALIDLFNKRAEVKVALGVPGATKELIEVINGRAAKEKTSEAAALFTVLAEAEAEKARTDAGLAPGAPPPRISPGSTLGEEMADLKRLNKNAREQVEGIRALLSAAGPSAESWRAATAAAAPPPADVAAAVTEALKAAYERVCFEWTGLNTKQNALKVYMNTFYGEAGNSLSPFFLLELAGGVTSAGQYNIKAVADFVRSKGFRIKYGDTDSLYLVAPAKYFAECDAEYVEGRISREDWWSAMVRITMRALNQIRDEVNAFLRGDNGSPYLKMAYEEVLYPVVFTGKKKYFGIPHLNEVNFRPKKLFIRGIDVVKQGQPGLAREIGGRIMWACMALDNKRSVRRIVEDVLRDAVVNGAQWNFEHFVKTDAWKPDKQNVSVHRFIARMRARHAAEVAAAERAGAPVPHRYELPEPGERFAYVIVKSATGAFDLAGRRADPKKGDLMEFARVAQETGLEVDVAYYMISYVIGLCARFINGDPAFQPANAARVGEKEADKASQKAAKKVLEAFIKGLGGTNSKQLLARGYAYRRAFKGATGVVRGALVERLGGAAASVLHGDWIDFDLLTGEAASADDEDSVVSTDGHLTDALVANAGLFVAGLSGVEPWCEEVGLALGFKPNGDNVAGPPGSSSCLYAAAAGIGAAAAPSKSKSGPPSRGGRPTAAVAHAAFMSCLDRAEATARAAIMAALPAAVDVATRYEADLSRLVSHLRLAEHRAHAEIGEPEPSLEAAAAAAATGGDAIASISSADRAALLELRRAWFGVVGVQMARRRHDAFTQYVGLLKAKRQGLPAAPPRVDRARVIAAAAAKLRPQGGIVG